MGRWRRKRRNTQIREIAVDRSDRPGKVIRAEFCVTLRGLIARGMAEKAGDFDEALRMAADKISGEITAILDGETRRPRTTERKADSSQPVRRGAPA